MLVFRFALLKDFVYEVYEVDICCLWASSVCSMIFSGFRSWGCEVDVAVRNPGGRCRKGGGGGGG